VTRCCAALVCVFAAVAGLSGCDASLAGSANSSPSASTPAPQPDVRAFLAAFLADWHARDRTGMLRRATSDVVDQQVPPVTHGETYRLAWSHACDLGPLGSGHCEFLAMENPHSFAMIYVIHYVVTPAGLRIDRLVPGGDAG
jgi:hypothetical protein